MAESRAVWGIDIGQAGLKAMRLRYAEAAGQVLAVAFDYIAHPKILSQPDAIPQELISQALDTFLERNDVHDDLLAISLPGQTALARFIQLPPVESSKVAEIVKYEARQQIPFALEDVIWDYQTLGGGIEESGFMLGAEVGLFAMKRDQVYESMQPFIDRKLEIDLVQIAPLALHNVACFDHFGIRKSEEFAATDDHVIVLDMGADNTTLLVTNGEKIWIRNVPIGGNHFTRALTKDMKLTFAKAEHLKCNATKSPDPRAVFQALRPVFNDYVSEIQRSIGYFSSVNRDAKIQKIMGVGNGFRLAGLQKFLQQNLQYEVERIDTFKGVVGDAVLNAPLFQDNILSFAVPYGLGLQALNLTKIETTLLPREISDARKIRKKKPWAVATAASLLAGLALSTAATANVAESVGVARFDKAEKSVATLISKVSRFKTEFTTAEDVWKAEIGKGNSLVSSLVSREYWPEIFRAINECTPRDVGNQLDEEDVRKKHFMNIKSITAKRYFDVGDWFSTLNVRQKENFMDLYHQKNPPTGDGYVFSLVGEHFHDEPDFVDGVRLHRIPYVVETILKNLQQWTVRQDGTRQPIPIRKMGISHATIVAVNDSAKNKIEYYPGGKPTSLTAGPVRGFVRPGINNGVRNPLQRGGPVRTPQQKAATEEFIKIQRTDFTIQFVWIPTPQDQRKQKDPLIEAKKAMAVAAESDDGQPAEDGQPPASDPPAPGSG